MAPGGLLSKRLLAIPGSWDLSASPSRRLRHSGSAGLLGAQPEAGKRSVPIVRLDQGGAALSGRGRTVTGVSKKYKEVRMALLDAGWSVARQRGSHEIWAHPDREDRIVVAGKDSDTVPIGTLGSIRRASGLEQLR